MFIEVLLCKVFVAVSLCKTNPCYLVF
uniref:Uncharacterized protein n=1 Tax=Arundo donax TaxID=35708 RepID=A0A0A8Z7G9_ARUDO